MAANAKKGISDEELRRRLLKLNQKVGAITSSTRCVYLRKLSAAEAASRSPIRQPTGDGAHRFSSDESDDDRHPTPSPVARSKSKTQPSKVYGDAAGPPSTAFNARIAQRDEEAEDDDGNTWGTSSFCRPSINGVGKHKYMSTNSRGVARNDDDIGYSASTNSYRNDFNNISDENNTRFRGSLRNDFISASSTGPFQRKLDSSPLLNSRDGRPLTESEFDRKFVWSQDKIKGGKWQFVPILLVALTAGFFLLLGYIYRHVTLSQTDPQNLLCASSDDNENQDCIAQQSLPLVLELAKQSVDFISSQAGDFECGYRDSRNITIQEFNFFIEQRKGPRQLSGQPEMKQLVLQLFVDNPHMNIQLYDRENLVTLDISSVKYLSSHKSWRSVWCRFRLSATKILSVIMSLLLGVLLLLLAFVGFKTLKRRKEEKLKEVLKLVESAIDKVKQQADSSHLHPEVLPYLAISHVRDSLIPLIERQKKQHIWDKVVEFINTHESRIRTEDQKIESEDFTVWRWVSPSTDTTKVWQGQAFGEHGNVIQNCPPTLTTCLKIRNMFDADVEYGGDWHVSIEDAILDKCGPDHEILHISANRASKDGCVYVRCHSLDSAGRAFKALHGWWFDGKLVTVKYLREQRYYERFPEAALASEPVRPSNSNQASLSRPFHSSITETS